VQAGASVVVTTVDSPAEFTGWLDRAASRGTDGALCVLHLPDSTELQRLAAARIPLVVFGPPEEPGPGIRSVGTTNWQGCLTATRHLIELGHDRFRRRVRRHLGYACTDHHPPAARRDGGHRVPDAVGPASRQVS
jgi:DNA-binding LacI/PurR family transcriptional regulator